jgi:hypothetical protein
MAAPEGNKYYKRREKEGSVKRFTAEELWEAFLEYDKYVSESPWYKYEAIKGGESAGQLIPIPTARPMTIQDFAAYLGLTYQGLKNYGEKEGYEDSFEVYTRISENCYNQKFAGAAVGAFNASIIARDLGLAEKTEQSGQVKYVVEITNQTEAVQ